MWVNYSYLDQQFAEVDEYLDEIRDLVRSGDFTLGKPVAEFERQFAELCGFPYAVGVGSGTDALALSLKAAGVGPGDEVITSPNTFVATVGAIAITGARPVFVDNDEQYTIDVSKIEAAITSKTKALLPVHLSGHPADMPAVMEIAERHDLEVVEDAAQSILAAIDGKHVGSWGSAAGFSLHPLKNLNVWGDGGIITTRSKEVYDKLRLLRNHGMSNRDEIEIWGHNSRLDSLQAVVAIRLLKEVHHITDSRIANAKKFDDAFSDLIDYITIPPRLPNIKQVYHTYVIHAKDRDKLVSHLLENGVSAKVHYPIPLHLQKAAADLGYKAGDFPVCEAHCKSIITLPVHQHLSDDEIGYTIEKVRGFYLS